MLILLLGSVAGLVVLRLVWWVVVRVLPVLADGIVGVGQGLVIAAIVGVGAGLIALASGGPALGVGWLVALVVVPFCIVGAVRGRFARRAPAARSTVVTPTPTPIPMPVPASVPESGDAQLWTRARRVLARHDPRVDLAEAQVRRFREYALRHPLDAEVIDYAPLVERRLAEAVDLAEEAVALAHDLAAQVAARDTLVAVLTMIGAGADDRLAPARVSTTDRLATLLAHVTRRANRTP